MSNWKVKISLRNLSSANIAVLCWCGTASSGFYRNIDGGVTVLKYPIGSQWGICSQWGIFPVYEKFYLKGLE